MAGTTEETGRELSASWLEAFVSRSPVPLLVFTLTGRTLAVSDAFTALTDYTLEDVPTGLDWLIKGRGMTREEAEREVRQARARLRDDSEHRQREYVIYTKRGERRLWLFQLAGVVTGDDGEQYLVTSALDITERRQQEEALLEHQRFIEQIFCTNPNVLYVFDLQRQASIYQNRNVAEAIGYSADEIVAMGGRLLEELGHPDDLPRLAAHFARLALAADGEIVGIEHRMRHRDGSWRWFLAQDTVFRRDEQGRVLEILGTSTDITGQKTAELALAASQRELQASEARYRGLVDGLPLLLCSLDRDGVITLVNEPYCKTFGKRCEELVGVRFLSLLPETERERVWRDISTLSPGRPTSTHEHEVLAPDGEVRLQRWTNAAVFDHQGHLVGYHSFGQDITDEVRARRERDAQAARNEELVQELQRHRDHLGQALTAAAAGAWTWRAATGRFHWSPELHALHAVGVDVELDLAHWLSLIHPDDRTQVHEDFTQAVLDRRDLDTTYRLTGTRGEPRWMRDVGNVTTDARGEVESIAGIRMDVTRHRSLEAQLAQAQKLDAIGQLAAGIAHDFNNLLLPIELSVDFCLQDAPEALHEHLEPIREASRRAAELTRQILAFSRKQILDARPVLLSEVVRGFAGMLQRLIGEHIEVTTELAPTLPAILADRAQLEQILLNLAVNARDAMPDGGRLTITTRRARPDEHGDADAHVVLEVADTGVGMDAHTRAHAFEPFFTTKARGTGTGLGLATVHGIAKQHGAGVLLDSAPASGTRVRVVFPATGAGTVEDLREPVEPETLFGDERILVVEDDSLVRTMVARALGLHGYRVDTVEHVDDAHAAVTASDYALLLTDVVMPRVNGKELYERLRVRRPALRVLYMSGYSDRVLGERGILDEGVELLAKPFTARQLVGRVRQILDRAPERAR